MPISNFIFWNLGSVMTWLVSNDSQLCFSHTIFQTFAAPTSGDPATVYVVHYNRPGASFITIAYAQNGALKFLIYQANFGIYTNKLWKQNWRENVHTPRLTLTHEYEVPPHSDSVKAPFRPSYSPSLTALSAAAAVY